MENKDPLYKDSMPWWGWVGAYMIIIAAILFWITPQKPLWLIPLVLITGYGGFALIRFFSKREKPPE